MEFRKTMDIDHILEWQPPKVSQQHLPPRSQSLTDVPSNSLGITGDREERAASLRGLWNPGKLQPNLL